VIQQPISVGCHSSSNGLFRNLPEGRIGVFVIPGCLTSEDEERETWTAESLRGLECLKASAFIFWDWTKDFGGTRFKGYTIVAGDVNRGQLVGFGRRRMVGPRQTL
jgi:hypothetical protein